MDREQIYWQGFMDKCASAGVDGEALLKEADFLEGLADAFKLKSVRAGLNKLMKSKAMQAFKSRIPLKRISDHYGVTLDEAAKMPLSHGVTQKGVNHYNSAFYTVPSSDISKDILKIEQEVGRDSIPSGMLRGLRDVEHGTESLSPMFTHQALDELVKDYRATGGSELGKGALRSGGLYGGLGLTGLGAYELLGDKKTAEDQGMLDKYKEYVAKLKPLMDNAAKATEAGIRDSSDPVAHLKDLMYGDTNPFWSRLLDNVKDEYKVDIKPSLAQLLGGN